MWSSFLPGVDQQLGHVCERKEVDCQIKVNKVAIWIDVVNEAGAVAQEVGWLQVEGAVGLASVEKGWIQGAKQTWQ